MMVLPATRGQMSLARGLRDVRQRGGRGLSVERAVDPPALTEGPGVIRHRHRARRQSDTSN